MHLLFVVNDLAYFRAHRERLALDIQAKGNTISVAAGNCEGVDLDGWDERINIYPINLDKHRFRPRTDSKLIWRLYKLIKKIEPDLVQCVTIKPILYGGLANTLCRLTSKDPKLVWTFAGLGKIFEPTKSAANLVRRFLVAFALKTVKLIAKPWSTFENEADLQYMVDAGVAIPTQSIAVMGTGLDTDHFSPDASNNHKTGPIVFYLATRLIGEKGVDTFLIAAKNLNESGAHCRCVLAGLIDEKNPDAVPLSRIERAVDRGDIEFLGAVSQADIPKTLRAADVFCMPSRLREGFPRSLLEAASCGVALIASDQPPMRILVPDQQTGWLISPPTSQNLEKTMRKALAHPEKTRQMGVHARDLVERLPVDASSIANAFSKVYESALRG